MSGSKRIEQFEAKYLLQARINMAILSGDFARVKKCMLIPERCSSSQALVYAAIQEQVQVAQFLILGRGAKRTELLEYLEKRISSDEMTLEGLQELSRKYTKILSIHRRSFSDVFMKTASQKEFDNLVREKTIALSAKSMPSAAVARPSSVCTLLEVTDRLKGLGLMADSAAASKPVQRRPVAGMEIEMQPM